MVLGLWAVCVVALALGFVMLVGLLLSPSEGTVQSVTTLGSSEGKQIVVTLDGGESLLVPLGDSAPGEGMLIRYYVDWEGKAMISWEQVQDLAGGEGERN